jgi:antitoxin (DNA-binding transcriptional repressor) of toxin-antitoxin stability system
MSGKMSGMETITVRELQKNLKGALEKVQRGAKLRVTRRRKVVAEISPPQVSEPSGPWPDLAARARSVMGRRILKKGAADEIIAARGDS